MDELLRVLADRLLFFFDDNRYRLSGSRVWSGFGDALIEFRSDTLVWALTRDRLQVFLDCRPADRQLAKKGHCTTVVLHVLLTGELPESALLTESMSRWLQHNLSDIEARFAPERLEETLAEVRRILHSDIRY